MLVEQLWWVMITTRPNVGEDNCSSCLGKKTVNSELMSRNINRFLMKDFSDYLTFDHSPSDQDSFLWEKYFVQRFWQNICIQKLNIDKSLSSYDRVSEVPFYLLLPLFRIPVRYMGDLAAVRSNMSSFFRSFLRWSFLNRSGLLLNVGQLDFQGGTFSFPIKLISCFAHICLIRITSD